MCEWLPCLRNEQVIETTQRGGLVLLLCATNQAQALFKMLSSKAFSRTLSQQLLSVFSVLFSTKFLNIFQGPLIPLLHIVSTFLSLSWITSHRSEDFKYWRSTLTDCFYCCFSISHEAFRVLLQGMYWILLSVLWKILLIIWPQRLCLLSQHDFLLAQGKHFARAAVERLGLSFNL